jgi:universal stress protein A
LTDDRTVRRILHPTDFSPASRPAFAKALELARERDAEVIVVHVLGSVAPMIGEGYVSPQAYEQIQTSVRTHGQKQLDALVGRATKAKIRARGLLLEGVPYTQIVRAARSQRADLIVMGTHGRGGIARLFLGSVAERVVASAPCPVLTVRGARGQ